jgi:beta-galactosidase
MLHLLPHWNWPNKTGQNIDVWAFSNCKEVELFLNGQSLGKKEMPHLSHLQWNVKYEPGTLSAKGYDDNGKIIAETKVKTAGTPAGIALAPDRAMIHADGEDCSVVTVAVTDSQGGIVPTANNLIHFEISGPGKIIGVGNGDAICHEPDVYVNKPLVRTVAVENWRMKKVSDVKNRPEVATDFNKNGWKDVVVDADTGPLEPNESAVFRARFSISNEDMSTTNAVLHIGMIDDEGWVYVNGQLVGESHDWRNQPIFDVQKFLHSGENTIAVVVKNNDGSGGVDKGVSLAFSKPPVPADWQRSSFNGLAEVIVQAGKDAGEIKLTARAEGIAPGNLVIHAEPHSARPAIP